MADDADTLKQALISVSHKLVLHQKAGDGLTRERDGILNQLISKGLLEDVTKSRSEDVGQRTAAITPTASQPSAATTSSLLASVAPGNSEKCVSDSETHSGISSEPRRRTHPQVVIPQTSRSEHLPVRSKACAKSISLLQSRAATESWEDGELEAQSMNRESAAEETSADELAWSPRPAKSTSSARSRKKTNARRQPKVPKLVSAPKSVRRISRPSRRSVAQIKTIEWVFWIQVSDGVGYWRPLADFTNAMQTQFKRKFDMDFVQTPRHIKLWMTMLSNRDKYLDRDICVGNVTYWGRNEPSKRKKAHGDKEKTCDTCFNAGRFCARMVKVGGMVKLGFFPALDAEKTAVDWRKIRHWVGVREMPAKDKTARREMS